MKRFIKNILFIFSLLLVLSLPVHAQDQNIGGEGGNSGDKYTRDGGSPEKSLFIIWVSDGRGNPLSKVIVRTFNGERPYSASGSKMFFVETSRFGMKAQQQYDGVRIAWNAPAFGNSGETVDGKIKSFLREPYNGYESGATWVCENYLNMTSEEMEALLDKDEVYLNIESGMYAGLFKGVSHTGVVLAGSCTDWAKASEPKSWLGVYSHNSLPNGLHYEDSWLGLAIPEIRNGRSDRYTSEEILSNKGYGIVSVRLKSGSKQLVKIYTDDNGNVDKTVYSSCSSPYSVENESEYKVVKWSTSKQRTQATSDKASWNEVVANCELVQNGNGVSSVTLPESEEAIFILYEKDIQDVIIEDDRNALKAFELNFVYPKLAGSDNKRIDSNWTPEEFDFKAKLDAKKSSMNSRDDIRNYDANESNFKVVENIIGDLSSLNISRLNLYHTGIGQYKPYNQSKDFNISELVKPHYSYNLARTLWEPELRLSSYRTENAGLQDYVNNTLMIPSSNMGSLTSANLDDNVENLLQNTKSDTYEFSAEIGVEYEEGEIVSHDGSDGNTYAIGAEVPEDVTLGDANYGNFKSRNDVFSVDIAKYSVEHSADKFKVKETPIAKSVGVGNIAAYADTNSIIGSVRYKEAIITELSPTLSVYPEVAYKTFVDEIDNYDAVITPDTVYMMGERKRQFKPPVVHGYYVTTNRGGRLGGATTLSTPSTGTIAEGILYDYMETGRFENGVTSMGSAFETGISDNIQMVISTSSIDFTNIDNTKANWGNGSYTAETSHDAYVNALINSSEQEILMQYFDKNGRKVGEVMHLPTSYSNMRVAETVIERTPITFKLGTIETLSDIETAVSKVLGGLSGSKVVDKWGIASVFDTMFISCTDPDSENNSGSLDSGSQWYGRKKWYDEESVGTLEVVTYTTKVTFGNMMADDKIDYNLLSQNTYNKYLERGSDKSLEARFYARLFFEDTNLNIDGSNFTLQENAFVTEVQNTSFIVSNFTSSENRK